ncbi:MAG: hypothetical protein GC154_10040 [bacterium]|nr:hypothetical protein [bacterium]
MPPKTTESNQILGEIVQTSTVEITGHCHRGHEGPAFGAFISAGSDPACVAVVYNIETASLDSHRRPAALGIPEDEIPKRYPQLATLLKKQFQALLIGEWTRGAFRFGLPGRPPALHAGIKLCGDEELRGVMDDLGFLRWLRDSNRSAPEELMLWACKNLLEAHGWRREEAVRVGKAISDVYRDDYETLRRLIARLESWLTD